MNAMRLMVANYNPVKQCQGCIEQDEHKVAAQILSYQVAELLLHRYGGTWQIKGEEIKLELNGFDAPLLFELQTGTMGYKTLRTSLTTRYVAERDRRQLVEDIVSDLGLPEGNVEYHDPLFGLFTKLIEIFHARCGLRIDSAERGNQVKGWVMTLSDQKLSGWISADFVAENRMGERIDVQEWFKLRPEKAASYVFGFYRFCKNYPSPVKEVLS